MEAALDAGLAAQAPGAEARQTIVLSVPSIVCGNCIRSVENTLRALRGVEAARANLTTKRVSVVVDPSLSSTIDLAAALERAGFPAAPLIENAETEQAARVSELLPRLGVAGFAAGNIMMLSVAVWSGEVSDMDRSLMDLLHWLSALIALPAVAYAGQPFFKSALAALRSRRLNMDVPISLGVLLATGMSLFQTMRSSEQIYFDAATTLLFFLLIGRVLDERMRTKARGAAENLIGLRATNATLVAPDQTTKLVLASTLKPGMIIAVAAGERVAGDGQVISGQSDIDESLISGETRPRAVSIGDPVYAGTINCGGTLRVRITAAEENTLLSEIGRLMLNAEQSRGRYVRLADRASQIYAPAVHVLGLLTFILWMALGAPWDQSLTHAIAVLIITCPCALALAVPAVQVAAMSRLFSKGVIVKAPDGLERLAEIDCVVFDKTGTLTTGELRLETSHGVDVAALGRAGSIAGMSKHPFAQALAKAARAEGIQTRAVEGVEEVPGSGLVTTSMGFEEKVGSAAWVGVGDRNASIWYAAEGKPAVGFDFVDELRTDAAACVSELRHAGYLVRLLSGDRRAAVAQTAAACSIKDWTAEVRPDQKLEVIEVLKARGYKTLMVGDGLNDAPALAAGHASLSPASAIDIAQTTADAVFQGDVLRPVIETLSVAKAARRLALQNFAIAILYNSIFVPLAMAGYVTPLIAALAMSGSSIMVTANALRLRSKALRLPNAGASA
ncbi:heavy metal translocating P-type ATPase [Hyphomicrobium facile]|uniref:Cu2+-exporting ATPase n=1 Tax=Hyphomicrobium facile TaxID=51670 RepID=A0A1I7N1G8_9HYPH|nr:heavy metal translocating P-type ATPase [Hyphomicrobium facile]SFV28500.1 Cu2+-exporting ATPase [Hyphomicrobium facile]